MKKGGCRTFVSGICYMVKVLFGDPFLVKQERDKTKKAAAEVMEAETFTQEAADFLSSGDGLFSIFDSDGGSGKALIITPQKLEELKPEEVMEMVASSKYANAVVLICPVMPVVKDKAVNKKILAIAEGQEFKKYKPEELTRFVVKFLSKNGLRITAEAVEELVRRTGYLESDEVSLSAVNSELSKLIVNGTDVDKKVVEELVQENSVASSYAVADAVVYGNVVEADEGLRLLAQMKGVNAQTFLSLLVKRYRMIFNAGLLTEQGVPQKELAKALGVYRVPKMVLDYKTAGRAILLIRRTRDRMAAGGISDLCALQDLVCQLLELG